MFQPHPNSYDIRGELSELTRNARMSNDAERLADLVADLVYRACAEGTEGKADIPGLHNIQGRINVIPSEKEGVCCELLLAFCFNGDNFNERLREIAYHAGIHCPETKLVILVTSQWIAKDWKKNHEQAFNDLNAAVVIYFAGFGRLTRLA